MILPIMIVLCGSAALGKPIITVQFNPLFIESLKGWKAGEEKYLQTNLNFEKRLEEKKRVEYEIKTIRQRKSEYKKCCCKEIKEKEQIIEEGFCLYHWIFKYTHWLREKLTSAEVRKEELKTLVEHVQTILKVVKDTYQHEKAEWELNKDQSEDYEIIDKGIVELEQEVVEWQNILTELESKLGNFQVNEQQTQIIQPTFNWKNN